MNKVEQSIIKKCMSHILYTEDQVLRIELFLRAEKSVPYLGIL